MDDTHTRAADLKAVAGKAVHIIIEVTNREQLFSFWVAEDKKSGASRESAGSGWPGYCKANDTGR